MADRETIMTWLKKCGNGGCSSRCPYDDLGPDKCYETLMTDALELLKEQPMIVRCKDCIKRERLSCPKMPHRPDDWFCADGEVKQE